MLRKVREQLADMPELLRQQILLRLGAGVISVFLFAVILLCSWDFRLCFPCLILAAFLIVNGSILLYNCIKDNYLCLNGSCVDIQTAGIRKKVKTIHVNINGVTVQIHVKQRIKGVSIGDTIVLYISDHTPVYENSGVHVVYSYYAIGVKKEV